MDKIINRIDPLADRSSIYTVSSYMQIYNLYPASINKYCIKQRMIAKEDLAPTPCKSCVYRACADICLEYRYDNMEWNLQ